MVMLQIFFGLCLSQVVCGFQESVLGNFSIGH